MGDPDFFEKNLNATMLIIVSQRYVEDETSSVNENHSLDVLRECMKHGFRESRTGFAVE